jgi:hypothetical protein
MYVYIYIHIFTHDCSKPNLSDSGTPELMFIVSCPLLTSHSVPCHACIAEALPQLLLRRRRPRQVELRHPEDRLSVWKAHHGVRGTPSHTNIHRCTHTPIHPRTNPHIHTHTQTHTHTNIHTQKHTHTNIHTHKSKSHKHKHTHTTIHSHSHTQTQTDTEIGAETRTETDTWHGMEWCDVGLLWRWDG